ncbi:MAG TPA: carboxymuconolactone decarboxylase family protein [Mycobacteriales bacterium]|nr:carboxymuconolactone decarboxylase family protein [Mycobacteriales bacterium]
MPTRPVDIGKTQPASYNALMELHHASHKAALDAGLDARLVELVKIRASQINGCAFCLRMHSADAIKLGESAERLAVLAAWRETDYFTDTERAALELAECVTTIATAHLSEDTRVRVSQALTDEQIAAVHWLGIVINAFNRVAISSHIPVRPS